MSPRDGVTAPRDWRASGVLHGLARVRTAAARHRQLVLLAAFVLFVVITVLSFRSLPRDTRVEWWPVPVVLLVTTPLTVLLNAAEFRVMGAVNGHTIGWAPALRLTVVAGAANLLPLPGGVIVRTEALRERGSSYKHALGANAAAGMAWLGVGCLTIGLLLAVPESKAVAGFTLVVAGACTLVAVVVVLRAMNPATARTNLRRLVAVEAGTVLVGGARLFLLFKVLGLSASVAQSVALTASQIIAAAVGIFPAGLGLRELIAGGIGHLVALSAGAAVAVTAVDRIATQLVLGVLTAGYLIRGRRATPTSTAGDGDMPAPRLP